MSINKKLSFRSLINVGAIVLTLAALLTGPNVSAQTAQTTLESEYIMSMVIQLAGAPMDTGHTSVAPLGGGTFSGPGLNGIILPGGADWMTQESGHSSLDVRVTLQTDDGEYIYLSYVGVMHPTESGLYWKVTPNFQTSSEKYDWVNHIVAVGQGYLEDGDFANGVFYDIFQIL
ncbi:MAG: DUF3237 domain-containing protein [Gammaproteobacteria bacterium]|nr:DUF3237 domain-containing protein [Gammaproteobacteria bacterium]